MGVFSAADTPQDLTDAAGNAGEWACNEWGNRLDAQELTTAIEPDSSLARGVRGAGRWKDNDPTPQIRRWFEDAGFEEIAFDAPDDSTYSVGVNRLVVPPQPLELGVRLFSFFR